MTDFNPTDTPTGFPSGGPQVAPTPVDAPSMSDADREESEAFRAQRAANAAIPDSFTIDAPVAPSGPNYIARDYVTGDYYGGLVDTEVSDLLTADGAPNSVLCVQRSVIVDRFGNTESVWVLAPPQDLPGALPGEYRQIAVEEVEAN